MYFTIERASGGFRARIYGANNEEMFLSEVYTDKESAQRAIGLVKRDAADAAVLDRTI